MKKYEFMLHIIFYLFCFRSNVLYAHSDSTNAIIFWKYDQALDAQYLEGRGYDECKKNFQTEVIIDLEEFNDFSCNSLEFIWKKDSRKRKEIMNRCNAMYKKYKTGNIFYSIVINNNIILSGLNRIPVTFMSARVYESDDTDSVYITQTPIGNLQLSKDYIETVVFGRLYKDSIPTDVIQLLLDYYSMRRS